MFRLLATTIATTKYKRQQIAILIISFFAYVAGIRNDANNMLSLQQQQKHQQQTTIENSNYPSQPTNSNFRPSPIIDFTPADAAAVPQQFKPTYIESNPNGANSNAVNAQKQEIENDNRRYTIEKAQAATVTYGNIAKKQFSFPNEQQQQHTLQHLTDKPIYIYRDPYTNENYHYTPTEAHVKETPTQTVYTHNNYNNNNNNNGYKQQQQYQNNDNREYLVQSSMIVGTQQHQNNQQQQQQQQPQQQEPVNPYRPYMSLSADKDVYLKRPGIVYDEKTGYKHPNSLTDKKSEAIKDKISYDSHDYPPPSYSQQQTSNFLPTPVPATPKPKPTPPSLPSTSSSIEPFRQNFKPTSQPWIFSQQRPPQQQYLQSSSLQTTLPNYANNIDNYLLNKQPSADYYRTEQPPPSYLQKQPQPQLQLQYEYDYDTRPPPYQQEQYASVPQYPTYENVRPPQQSPQPPSFFNSQQSQYPSYENVRPLSSSPPSYLNAQQQPQYPSYENVRPPSSPPGRPSYNNYYDYQIGEIPPTQEQSFPHFNYPYPRPPPSQYPYQGLYRPTPPPPPAQQQSGLASLVQYAPQFTSLLLNGVGGGGGGGSSSSNSPLSSLLGALTGGAGGSTTQQSSSNLNRRPVNSQLIRALENIAHNDDLQCVPKVLCQMIAGQTERGQLPAFITSPAITNFLSGFPAASPALIYGRAALLGLSGGEKSCHQTYVKCPKNEYEIIYYLNNHRGGFFKFFSEPEEQQQNVNHDATQQGATSLFSILAALTGTPAVTTTTPRPTRKPQAPAADVTSGIGNFFTQLLSDYMGGATVEYQRSFKGRRKRSLGDKIKFEGDSGDVIRFEQENHQEDILKFHNRNPQNDQQNHSEAVKFQDEDDYDAYTDINQDHYEQEEDEDFHDEEDEEDTQQVLEFQDDEEDDFEDTQGRILHRTTGRKKRIKFFPQTRENPNENDKEPKLENIIKKFNDLNRQRKLKFPSEPHKREYLKDSTNDLREGKTLNYDLLYEEQQQYGQKFTNYVKNSYEDFQKDSKKIKFVDDNSQEQSSNLYSYYLQKPKDKQSKLIFPERQGKILNHPYYAASYLEDYYQNQQQQQQQPQQPEYESQTDDKFIITDNQRPSRFSEFPSLTSTNIYNTHINSQLLQNSFSSNTAVNNHIYVASSPGVRETNSNHFLPTPPPSDDRDYPSSNAIYSSSVFNGNYNSLTQREFQKTQRYTSPTSTSFSSNIANSYTNNNNNRYNRPSSISSSSTASYYTTKRPYLTSTTKRSDDKNIYVTNSRGVTEYFLTPDGRKVYL